MSESKEQLEERELRERELALQAVERQEGKQGDDPLTPRLFNLNDIDMRARVQERRDQQQAPPERKEDIELKIQQIFNQLQDARVTPFQTEDFSVRRLFDLFQSSDEALLDDPTAKQRFFTVTKQVIDEALFNNDPQRLAGIFATLGIVASDVLNALGGNPAMIIESIVEQIIPIEKFNQIQGRITHPVNIGLLIELAFTPDLQRLEQRNLSQNEIESIRRAFQGDLQDLRANIVGQTEHEIMAREYALNIGIHDRPEQPIFTFGQNTFIQLQQYIQSHVHNNLLRQLLLADIQQQIFTNRDDLGIQLGAAPPKIEPLSINKLRVVRGALGESISNTLGEELREINRRQQLIDASDVDQAAIIDRINDQRDRVLTTVRSFNRFANRNSIIDSRTGLVLLIPTEQRIEISQSNERPQFMNVAISNRDLIESLNRVKDDLLTQTQSFEYVATQIRDPGAGQSREQIINDLIKMERLFLKKRAMRIGKKKKMKDVVRKRASLQNILTMVGLRRRQMTLMNTGTIVHGYGARMREIQIMKDATLAELAKIANMIAMENGSLEDINENPILDVMKGMTTIQEIVNAIMEVQKMNAGQDFSIIFVPANVFGGMFLAGSLDTIMKNRMLSNPVGGDIFSSLFNSVGNVIKTVASVPLQLAGAVFGGGLKESYVKADAAQYGGAVHIRPDFLRGGEVQPEPYGQTGENQTFRIQPYPFGGRIDNTGFIDSTQRNNNFALGDVPVINLTHFR